jgi:hypothetical protein
MLFIRKLLLGIEEGGTPLNKNYRYVAFLCCMFIFIVSGCANQVSSNTSDESEQIIEPITKGDALPSSFTDNRLPGMKGIEENEKLQLFVDEESGSIAIVNKESDKIWYSNPSDRDTDAIASGVNKSLLSAQMQIDFFNKLNQANSINTFTDSVAHNQFRFDKISNGVRVSYQLGTAGKSIDDLPLMLSKERFEALSNKLDKAGQRALLIAYKENKETSIYDRNDSALNGLQLEKAIQAFEDAGYTEEDLQQDMQELNFTQEKASARIFQAAIEYTLDEESLVVNVPVSSIKYPEDYPVNMISLLNFFGAAGTDEEGSLFVPDGSGALIHFNNGKTKHPSYQQSVYGKDLALKIAENNTMEQKVRLPVFGMIFENDAILGVIEKGASVANINADISGRLNSYNYVYPSFYVVNKDEVTLKANEQERTLPKFQDDSTETDYTVRYLFLNDDEASYVGMAKSYQNYLLERNGLPQTKESEDLEDMPFYLDVIGSISKQKHVLGVPYKSMEPLTTFEETEEIVNQLQSNEINHIKLKYSGWFNGGVNQKVPEDISVEKAIGGEKGLKNFLELEEQSNITVFPDVALLQAYEGNGLNVEKEASRTLKGTSAAVYPIDITIDRRDRTKSPAYVLSPKVVEDYAKEIVKELNQLEIESITLRDLADQLNSDFKENKQIDRAQSEEISKNVLEYLNESGLHMMAEGGNAYALPYVSDIIHAPIGNSNYKLEDEEIPFYQMVVRGFINYTGEPFNLSTYTDIKEYVLKCLEYGAGVHFKWIHAPNYSVKDTEFDYLYSIHYQSWLDKAVSMYSDINSVLKNVQNEKIKSHEKLAEGVYQTIYENNLSVIVNYNNVVATVNGNTIEPMGYIIGGVE